MIKTSTTRILAILLPILLLQFAMSAQCPNTNQFWMHLTTDSDGDIDGTDCIYGGEFVTADVCFGVTYVFSTCGTDWDTEITLYSEDGFLLGYDDEGCGITAGPSYLEWTSDITGLVYVLVNQYECESNEECALLTMTQYGDCDENCLNNNSLNNANATPSGVGIPVTVPCLQGGQYVNVSVQNGTTYLFDACGSPYDSQLSVYTSTGMLLAYDDDGCGEFAGASSMLWTSNWTGTVRLVLDEYPCLSNTSCTSLTVVQLDGGCDIASVEELSLGCEGSDELVNFYVNYDGGCTVDYMNVYSDLVGWVVIDLTADGIGSGDPVSILFPEDETNYDFYFELSDGTLSDTYVYTTGTCIESFCEVNSVMQDVLGCEDTDESVDFYVNYDGACTVDYMWVYSPTLDWIEIDLTFGGFTSGDPIGILFPEDNTEYFYYFVLSDGSESLTYSYLTGDCDVAGCVVTMVEEEPLGCESNAELVNYYVHFTGDCEVSTMWISVDGSAWMNVELDPGILSGDMFTIAFNEDNAIYDFYFELNDGATSEIYTYITSDCDDINVCENLTIDHEDTGCAEQTPTGIITPEYDGDCIVAGIYTSVNGGAFEFLDLSAYGFVSGDEIGLFFNVQESDYEVFYVLEDGTESPSVFFTTESCESGEMICDCAGTQLPIESLAWLGDGTLDDGEFLWGGDPSLPVDFSCATWGFDCGDEIPEGSIAYDPYGVCSGSLPPANGCVDEFCYSVDLDVVTDCFPDEVSVMVYNSNGDLVVFIPEGTYTESYTLHSTTLCLPAGCYTYVINDSFGDGMSSGDCVQDGAFGVWDWGSESYIFYLGGDEYGLSYTTEFCVGPQTQCEDLSISISDAPCFPGGDGELLPTISYVFDFDGPCTVETIYLSVDGGDFEAIDVSANGWGSGDEGSLYYLQPDASYTLYYVTDDGASSFLYDFTTGNCDNEPTICDCEGTQLSIGVLSWLGDGFADNGFYEWGGLPVNFNCATWGYDCTDIEGAPSFDPYNVCEGQLPPFNGCIEEEEILGCMDPEALNYNPDATISDGSCIYNVQEGCMDEEACNYNELAIVDDGSCDYTSCVGCTNELASNYDPTATIDDGSCIFIEIEGCTDEDALNYNPLATEDDGSCIMSCDWPVVVYDAHCSEGDLDNFYVDVEVFELGNGAPYTITNSYNNQQMVVTLLSSLTMGPFPAGAQVVVQVTSNPLGCLLTSQPLSEDCSTPGVYGCTDPEALNYDQDATIDDGSCEYPEPILGCTDPEALNYNPDATLDDGSCEYPEPIFGCTNPEADNYNPDATIDDGSCIIFGCTDPEALNYNPEATDDDGSCEYPGVNEVEMHSFGLYPNPARESVIITNNGNHPLAQVRIMESTGRLVQSLQLAINNGEAVRLDVSQLAQGNYIVEITSGDVTEHHQMVIQH